MIAQLVSCVSTKASTVRSVGKRIRAFTYQVHTSWWMARQTIKKEFRWQVERWTIWFRNHNNSIWTALHLTEQVKNTLPSHFALFCLQLKKIVDDNGRLPEETWDYNFYHGEWIWEWIREDVLSAKIACWCQLGDLKRFFLDPISTFRSFYLIWTLSNSAPRRKKFSIQLTYPSSFEIFLHFDAYVFCSSILKYDHCYYGITGESSQPQRWRCKSCVKRCKEEDYKSK